MIYRLPNYRDLTIEQRKIIDLPLDKNFVIEGGPGTGKSVLAAYRAKRISEMKSTGKVLVLVYNRPLAQFMSEYLIKLACTNCEADTYYNWLYKYFNKYFNGKYPNFGEFKPNWKAIEEYFDFIKEKYEHIIIDETQDFPIELLQILKKRTKYMTCFIDGNQAIYNTDTNTSDVIDVCGVGSTIKLVKSFRCSKEIFDVCKEFCNTINVRCDNASGLKPIAVDCGCTIDYEKMNEVLVEYVKLVKNNLNARQIGIIVNRQNVDVLYKYLKSKLQPFNVQKHVEIHHTLDFSIEGVKIVTYGTMKGLEFDAVILPCFERVYSTGNTMKDSNRLYVAGTRANKLLAILYFSGLVKNTDFMNTIQRLRKNKDALTWRYA